MSGVYLAHRSIDDYIANTDEPITMVNDINTRTDEGFNQLRALLYTQYDGSSLPTMPSCRCGELYGEYAIGRYHDKCQSYVKDRYSAIVPLLGIRQLTPDLPFLTPAAYNILRSALTRGKSATTGMSVLDIITNNKYDWTDNATPSALKSKANHNFVAMLYEHVIPEKDRGYRYFIDNYFNILESLVKMFTKLGKHLTVTQLENIIAYSKLNADSLFTKHLLLPNSIWLTMEKTAVGKYTNQDITPVLDAAVMAARFSNPNLAERTTVNILNKLHTYANEVDVKQLDAKPGLLRKHVYGTRVGFSFRAVITSVTDECDYECIHLPWSASIEAFRPYIINGLTRRGYNYKDACAVISNNMDYNKDVDDIFQEMIKTWQSLGYKGIPITTNRNPSIKNGSFAIVYGVIVKTDPFDLTMGVPTGIIKPFNADFDGDHMNNTIPGDKVLTDLYEPLSTAYALLSDTYPEEISSIYIPGALLTMVNNYLNDDEL